MTRRSRSNFQKRGRRRRRRRRLPPRPAAAAARLRLLLRGGGRRRLLGGAVVALGIIAVAVVARRVKLERLRRVDQEGDALGDLHTQLADGRGGREEVLLDAGE